MNRSTRQPLNRWWPVWAAVFIVLLVYGIGGVVLLNDATRPPSATPPPRPADANEQAPDALFTRGLTDLPPDYPTDPDSAELQRAKDAGSYLLSPGEEGYTAQEDAAVRDNEYFLGGVHPHEDQSWRAYPQPTPGMALDIDGEFSCTLAFVGHYAPATNGSGDGPGSAAALTAGHCMESDEDGIVEWSPGAEGYPVAPLGHWDAHQALDSYSVEVGSLSEHFAQNNSVGEDADDPRQEAGAADNRPHEGEDSEARPQEAEDLDSDNEDTKDSSSERTSMGLAPAPKALPAQLDTDWASMSLDPRAGFNPRIDGRYDVVTTAGAADLRPGMMVCKMGFRTGETCGPVLSWNATMVRINLYSLTGDSGSPAYIKLGGNKVAALGLLSGSPVDSENVTNDYVTDFALVAPVMRATGFRLGEGG
ncbi:chymotrypsin family serine protease [Corynebacterium urogenitale]